MSERIRRMAKPREFQNLIAGKVQPASGGGWFDSINPTTGEVWARFPASDESDAVAAVVAAKAASVGWATLNPSVRSAYLQQVAEVFRAHGDELGELETTDNGNLYQISRYVNGVSMGELWVRAAHETVSAATGRTVMMGTSVQAFTQREPYGVVAAIVPFNMPIGMFGSKAAMALAGGNTVVVKPPEQASAGILRAGELLAEVLPPGVLNIVAGFGDVGEAFVRHPDVAKVTMTGSSATAKLIQGAGADTLTPSVFELGGKSPNIVFADADLDAAAHGTTIPSVYGFNAGQACVAGSRILIQRPVLEEMLERIQAKAQAVLVGDPFDSATGMGPLVSQEQYDRVVGFLEVGAQEAERVFGGRHGGDVVPELPGGYWVEPTLFLAKDNELRICREEIFGPVGVVLPFDTEEEAIAIANDTRYGLAAGVWTRDSARMHRCVNQIQSGNVWGNTYMQIGHELPFGGFKESGYGHDEALEFTREKAVVIAVEGPLAGQHEA
jgi:(Z)-2-((N-methylformamido)methylene)-5-hydroxybutyrolactone dehydrogenase